MPRELSVFIVPRRQLRQIVPGQSQGPARHWITFGVGVAAAFWFADVQQGGPSGGRWVVRNLVPLLAWKPRRLGRLGF